MNIIFHYPLPVDKNARSASGIRPLRMLEAFDELGFNVDLVAGSSAERKRGIARIQRKVRQGVRYEFVYAESSTMPTALTDPHHLPLRPFMDWRFFEWCKAHSIPVGLFYRDVYWRFESYGVHLNAIKKALAIVAYRFDLWVYQRTLRKLYLPSMEMGRYIPSVHASRFEALPPGHASPSISPVESVPSSGPPLKLFYVGGMSSHYQLHELFKAVRELPQVELTICTRQTEWQEVKHEYADLTPNIKVIHEAGTAMESHLVDSHVAVLFVRPQEYREFAAPMKLYEYLGYGKPILATEGTLAGRFVRENGIGWAIPYRKHSVQQLLSQLVVNPAALDEFRGRLTKISKQHSWRARAEQVVAGLSR